MKERIRQLLKDGESRTIEFKEARSRLNRDVYDTVCSFLNRDGGDIALGVTDGGTVQGVVRETAEQMRQDFANAVNNPEKLNPPYYLSLEPVEFRRKLLLHVYVPPSSQVHRHGSRIFDRNEDADIDITNNQQLLTAMFARKQSSYSENTLYPYADLADLEPGILDRVRHRVAVRDKNHAWVKMDDLELLKSARLHQQNLQDGKEGLTLAALLLFGKETAVLAAVSHHRTDALLRRVNVDRYDDRDDIRTNLLDSYNRLIAFGEKHLPDPFYLEGDQRVSLRSRILREVVGNLLIHREYMNPFPAKLIIEHGRLTTENANKPHGHGPIDPARFSPYPKNPVIARLFKELGMADELGSGVRNLYRYGPAYGGRDPELLEDDIFRVVVAVPDTDVDRQQLIDAGSEKTSEKTSEIMSEKTSEKILRAMRENPEITIAELAARIGVTDRTIERNIHNLQQHNRLRRKGPAKGGHWEVQG